MSRQNAALRVQALRLAFLLMSASVLSSCALVNANLQEVEPARLYRSGQMTGAQLRATAEALGIRTVINLRGARAEAKWWEDEIAVCKALNIAHHDLWWREIHLPEPESLATFVRLLATAEEPVLVHCKAGVQRAAFGAAVFRLREGASPCVARRQFGLFFFDARIGDVVDLYEGSDLPFDQWVLDVYPALYRDR